MEIVIGLIVVVGFLAGGASALGTALAWFITYNERRQPSSITWHVVELVLGVSFIVGAGRGIYLDPNIDAFWKAVIYVASVFLGIVVFLLNVRLGFEGGEPANRSIDQNSDSDPGDITHDNR